MSRLSRWAGMVCLAIFLAGLSLAPVPAAAADPVKWVLTTPFGAESYGGKGVAWVIDRINEKSGGKLVIEPYYASSLGYKSPEYLKVFKDGLVDMAAYDAFLGGKLADHELAQEEIQRALADIAPHPKPNQYTG